MTPFRWHKASFSKFVTQENTLSYPGNPDILIRGCRFSASCYRREFFDQLMGAPTAGLRGAGIGRHAEFIAGRYLARKMLLEYGIRDAIVGRGCRGEALWPSGFTGSISHCADRVVCAVAPQSEVGYIGLDIESVMTPSTAKEIEHQVVSPEEMALAIKHGIPFAYFISIAFSAKESLFKAVNQEAGKGFGFHSTRVVDIRPDGMGLTLALCASVSLSLSEGRRFACFVGQYGGLILTLIAE